MTRCHKAPSCAPCGPKPPTASHRERGAGARLQTGRFGRFSL